MLESFFILSLGITFVLVLFLVYHFKQRLTILENKCDTTFEIINNVVSELGNIRGAFRVGGASTQMPPPATPRPEGTAHSKINVTISDDEQDISDYEDDEDSGDEDSGDEDSNSEHEGSDDDDDNEDSDSEIHDVAEKGECVANIHTESNNDSNSVRIINLDNQQEFDIIETVDDLNTENGNRDDIAEDESSHIENMEEIKLHVEKLPTSEPHLDDSSITSSVTESKHNSHIYKKMTLPVLKAYVIEKGLVSDPSKMKKQELIQLIESSDI